LNEGHSLWLRSIQSLSDDSELDRDRLTNWGERLPTRIIIWNLIAHDLYHAGEINHSGVAAGGRPLAVRVSSAPDDRSTLRGSSATPG
jgi:hypothetical protein